MKHAGSVRYVGEWNLNWMLKVCALLSFLQMASCLTPPRIIYGGWTPILPGSPFYFGPIRWRSSDYPQYPKSPVHEQFHGPPLHNVEHHFEEHIQFVDPGPYNTYSNQPQVYSHSSGQHHNQGQQISGYNGDKEIYSQSPPESVYNGSPYKSQQTSGYNGEKQVYSQSPPESVYKGSPYKSEQISGYNGEKEIYSQPPPESVYNGSPYESQQTSGYNGEKQVYSQSPPESVYKGSPYKSEQVSGYNGEKEIYSQSPPESVYKGSPYKSEQITSHDLGKHAYSQISPQLPYIGSSGKEQSIPGHEFDKGVHSLQPEYDSPPVNGQHLHKTNKGAYSHYSSEPKYGERLIQNANKGQQVSNVHLPGKETYVQVPPQSYDVSHAHQSDKDYPIANPTPNKDIYAYYPPQSVYDGPKEHEIDYKPVYIENPKKPLENPRQIPYIIPTLKDIPIENLNLHDINTLRHAGKNTFLTVTPIGEVDSDVIKQISNIHLDQIKYLAPSLQKNEKYPIIKNSPGPSPKHPTYNAVNYFKDNIPISKLNYGSNRRPGIVEVPYNIHQPSNYKYTNNYKGSAFPQESHQPAKRPLNPIETKKYRNAQLQMIKSGKLLSLPKINDYKDITILSDIPVSSVYPPSSNMFSDIKYQIPTKTLNNPLVISKNVLPHSVISKNLAKQLNKYTGPRYTSYSPVKPFYPKTTLSGSIAPYSSLPKSPSLIHLPLRTMPRPVVPKSANYLTNNVKLQTIYKNPSIVTNIRGSPALIEREVAILHVPVRPSQQDYVDTNGYPKEKEYLYYTASTPESTQIPDFNRSAPYVSLHKHTPVYGRNESYPHIRYAVDKDSNPASFADPSSEEPSSTSQEIDNNSIHNPSYQTDYTYIFVSSSGVHGDKNHNGVGPSNQQDLKKQFFHAYYAPGDHVAPPGYVKMTIQEFNNLFKNAEIRYVDKDPSAIPRSNSLHNSQSAS